jgi:hypothetical protein
VPQGIHGTSSVHHVGSGQGELSSIMSWIIMLLFGASHVITSTQSPLLFAWAFASFPSVRLLVYLRVVSSLALPGRRMPSLSGLVMVWATQFVLGI